MGFHKPEKRALVETAWKDFAATCLPSNAGAVQRTETRRAFFAGALALFSSVNRVLSDGDEITPEDIAIMEGLRAEFQQYQRDLETGRA